MNIKRELKNTNFEHKVARNYKKKLRIFDLLLASSR